MLACVVSSLPVVRSSSAIAGSSKAQTNTAAVACKRHGLKAGVLQENAVMPPLEADLIIVILTVGLSGRSIPASYMIKYKGKALGRTSWAGESSCLLASAIACKVKREATPTPPQTCSDRDVRLVD